MSEIKLNPVTDYSKYIYSGPSYRVSKIVPISSGQTASLPSTSTTNVQFEIPTAVVNLAKSKLFLILLYLLLLQLALGFMPILSL